MNITLNLNEIGILKDSKKRVKKSQVALDAQVVKDSNYYCPVMDGTLRRSATRSQYGSGVVKWDTVYAARQYYEDDNKSKDQNPNARAGWFEEAKATKKKKWEELADSEYNK